MQQSYRISFTNEISNMMFGFGDCPNPNPQTVELVEKITLDQMRLIVREAIKYSSDGKTLKGNELIFLMRRDPCKMRRFVRYLHNKKLKSINVNAPIDNDADVDEKPKCYLMQFIEKIDETGEFTDLSEPDEVKHERNLRANWMSQMLDKKKYLDFCKARSETFGCKTITMAKLAKLKNWIEPNPESEIIFQLEALEVLAYMAHQTVAEIVDYVLLLRMDSQWALDSFERSKSSFFNTTMLNYARRSDASIDYGRINLGHLPISVGEIKEIMRRVRCPQGGTLNFGGKLPETHYCFAL